MGSGANERSAVDYSAGSWTGKGTNKRGPNFVRVVRGESDAVEANHGERDAITTNEQIRRLVDISMTRGHTVPPVSSEC